MRMRFWATIRNPAFSISALTAPVRLRSVASGLMIEKVRSIAIVYVLAKSWLESCAGLYRRHLTTASDRVTRLPPLFGAFSCGGRARRGEEYSKFTASKPAGIRRAAAIQLRGRRLSDDRPQGTRIR